MHLFKFSLIFLSLFFSIHSRAFNSNECLNKKFSVEVNHKGSPFGMTAVSLKIEKDGCNINISHKKYKYLTSAWMIDVCRGPVHIKKGAGSVEVIKKKNNCSSELKDSFCSELDELSTVIQDDGLIFASGIKEDIESKHGEVYCSYLLLQRYLKNSLIFNTANDYDEDLQNLRLAVKKESKKEVAPRPVMDGDFKNKEIQRNSPDEETSTGEGSF